MKCNFCGSFYPSDEKELNAMLEDAYLNNKVSDKAKIAVAPHAGYLFSLNTAMKSHLALFNDLKDETIVILAPSHTGFGTGASVRIVETPIGYLPIDFELVDSLNLPINDLAVSYEHAVEVHLPVLVFLSKKFNVKLKYVPLVLAEFSEIEKKIVDNLIDLVVKKKIKILISSDFIHFGPSYDFMPFREKIDENFERLNYEIINSIISLNHESFLKKSATVCGKVPIYFVIKALNGKNLKPTVKLLEFTDSSKVIPSLDRVGYCSLVFDF